MDRPSDHQVDSGTLEHRTKCFRVALDHRDATRHLTRARPIELEEKARCPDHQVPGSDPVLMGRTAAALAEAETDKTRILSATVLLADIGNKREFDEMWAQWIGEDPQAWPQRSCHGVVLAANNQVEILVVAAR